MEAPGLTFKKMNEYRQAKQYEKAQSKKFQKENLHLKFKANEFSVWGIELNGKVLVCTCASIRNISNFELVKKHINRYVRDYGDTNKTNPENIGLDIVKNEIFNIETFFKKFKGSAFIIADGFTHMNDAKIIEAIKIKEQKDIGNCWNVRNEKIILKNN
jgi:hypothetical protein